ncbi:unnamed protein product [Bursaphelenchus xylophilus]|uniref:(pine wood nematode) hypothetical protein n=1 Tax=Bursaphelenchus xylophilus TaxID=6326 RepID=A0A1I7RMZ0_BURXY|nr:unnamed protein product [Bursaphelenchus xylophilus]CAG9125334.1 unnamed protein product [Bursaphelenchus xylophilus]
MDAESSTKVAALLLLILAVLGIFGNGNIVAATYRNRSLRSTCNTFIALTALADIVHQFGIFLLAYTVFTTTFTPAALCFKLQVVPSFGCSCSSMLLLITSIDRLVCIANPKVYEKKKKSAILYWGLVVTVLVSGVFPVISYLKMDDTPRICSPLQDMPLTVLPLYFMFNFVVIMMTLIAYLIIWINVRHKNYRKSKQLLRSITAISLCICCGWLLNMTIGVAVTKLMVSIDYSIPLFIGMLMNISIVLNYPLLFTLSRDYNTAFTEQLRIIMCNKLPVQQKIENHTVLSLRSLY